MTGAIPWVQKEQWQGSSAVYVPSSLEKKTAILGYLFVWLLILLPKKEVSPYVYIHVLRALGRRWLFIVNIMASLVLMWIPLIRILPNLVFIVLWFLWLRSVYTAWNQNSIKKEEGEDSTDPLHFFAGIGGWILGVLEIELKSKEMK